VNDLRWAGDKRPLVKMFNAERDRLGEKFDAELIRFVDDDPSRHYWSALFCVASVGNGKSWALS